VNTKHAAANGEYLWEVVADQSAFGVASGSIALSLVERPGQTPKTEVIMVSTAADRGREVRQRLLAATAELIAERGWAAVSTRMAAERAGVASGLVHYHFASVQALLSEAAVGVMRQVAGSVGATLAQARTPVEAVRVLVASLDEFTGSDQESVLFVETYLAATRDPHLREAVSGVIAEFRTQLAGRLGEYGVAAPGATAAVLAAAVDGLVMQRALDPTLAAETIIPILTRLLTPEGEQAEKETDGGP
jgi:AcrR family transcriptional regulator